MASLLGTLLEILRILRSSAKTHIRRFPRSCWGLLLAYLGRKLSEWWCSCPSKQGTHRNPKPANPSFPGGRGGSCLVSCSSTRGCAARVAASTVPVSAGAANRQSREGAGSQPETALPSSPIPATLSVDPPWVPSPNLNPRSHWVGERSPTNHSSGNLSVQSAGDSLSMISISRTSLPAPVQNDRPSQDPRETYGQFEPGPGASRSRGRSSRSPSPKPSLNTAQPHYFDIAPTGMHIHAHADRGISPTISPQISMDFPSPSSRTREQLSPPTIRRGTQSTTSIGWDIQNPSTESLPNTPLISAREFTEALMTVGTSAHSPHISLADRSETHSHTASSAPSDHIILQVPEGRVVQLINSDQLPRYAKGTTVQVDYFFIATQS